MTVIDGLRKALDKIERNILRVRATLDALEQQHHAIKTAIEKETGTPGLPLVKEAKR